MLRLKGPAMSDDFYPIDWNRRRISVEQEHERSDWTDALEVREARLQRAVRSVSEGEDARRHLDARWQ